MQAAPWSSRAAAKVLQHSQTFAVRDDFVGRAPWPAADPLVGLFKHRQSRTRGVRRGRGRPPHILVAALLLCGADHRFSWSANPATMGQVVQPHRFPWSANPAATALVAVNGVSRDLSGC